MGHSGCRDQKPKITYAGHRHPSGRISSAAPEPRPQFWCKGPTLGLRAHRRESEAVWCPPGQISEFGHLYASGHFGPQQGISHLNEVSRPFSDGPVDITHASRVQQGHQGNSEDHREQRLQPGSTAGSGRSTRERQTAEWPLEPSQGRWHQQGAKSNLRVKRKVQQAPG